MEPVLNAHKDATENDAHRNGAAKSASAPTAAEKCASALELRYNKVETQLESRRQSPLTFH
jgi:hypothetical protein